MNENIYADVKANSLSDKLILLARKKIYNVLVHEFPINELDSIIDVGVTADKDCESSNFFEKIYPYPDRITALSDQDASWMSETIGIKFVRGNALDMPFEDNSFDLVFSNAVIEHVGSRENQAQFIRECIRVSKKYVFITTPNRFFPMELHTYIPFLHWLPPSIYRYILKRIGKDFFALESNLNLFSRKDWLTIMRNIGHIDYKLKPLRFCGFKSNHLIVIVK